MSDGSWPFQEDVEHVHRPPDPTPDNQETPYPFPPDDWIQAGANIGPLHLGLGVSRAFDEAATTVTYPPSATGGESNGGADRPGQAPELQQAGHAVDRAVSGLSDQLIENAISRDPLSIDHYTSLVVAHAEQIAAAYGTAQHGPMLGDLHLDTSAIDHVAASLSILPAQLLDPDHLPAPSNLHLSDSINGEYSGHAPAGSEFSSAGHPSDPVDHMGLTSTHDSAHSGSFSTSSDHQGDSLGDFGGVGDAASAGSDVGALHVIGPVAP